MSTKKQSQHIFDSGDVKKVNSRTISANVENIACVDLFCGAGGLTHGMQREGLPVLAGIDLDPACRYPYEANNNARFIQADISQVTSDELRSMFGSATLRVLAGCAPCQPFSTYAQRYELDKKGKWSLLYEFARLTAEVMPEIVTMENVPTVSRHSVFHDFVSELEALGYQVWHDVVDCSEYGVPQTRKRMVLLASLLGHVEFIRPTRSKPKTVRDAIGKKQPLRAGEYATSDRLHMSASLSPLNLKRIKASVPGGTWKNWPKRLIADCHKSSSGATYPSVYGRMEWDKPAPTMTTQCYGFGNGRFGHPDQNRAISLREAAILQSFPAKYVFVEPGQEVQFKALGRLIGNAVPVRLGRAIGKSIRKHIEGHVMQGL